MEVQNKENDLLENDFKLLGQEINTKASGEPAKRLATYIGVGILSLFLIIGMVFINVINKKTNQTEQLR